MSNRLPIFITAKKKLNSNYASVHFKSETNLEKDNFVVDKKKLYQWILQIMLFKLCSFPDILSQFILIFMNLLIE